MADLIEIEVVCRQYRDQYAKAGPCDVCGKDDEQHPTTYRATLAGTTGDPYLTMTPEQAASDRATVKGYDTPHRHPAWAMVERWMAEVDARQAVPHV